MTGCVLLWLSSFWRRSFGQLSLPQPGLYLLRLTASNRAFSSFADLAVQAGDPALAPADPALALWLKFDESAGVVAADSSGNGNTGAVAGAAHAQLLEATLLGARGAALCH